MRSYKILLLCILMLGLTFMVNAQQCPTDENDLAGGGIFFGDCLVSVGSSVTITGIVNWTSGTLTINGGSGRIVIDNNAILNVQGGAVVTIDDGNVNGNTDGPIDILSGGIITVSEGASLTCAEAISVSGTLNIYGNMESLRSTFSIASGANIFIAASGDLITGGTSDNVVMGNLSVEGNLSIQGNMEVNGGSITITDDATVGIIGHLLVYNNGTVLIEPGGIAEVTGDVANADDSPSFPTLVGSGNFTIEGTLIVNDDLNIFNTTPDSQLLGGVGVR